MPQTEARQGVDEILAKLQTFFKENAFRKRGLTFNHKTSDGLTQVVQFQMGRFDPPGTHFIPGIRENLYGRFTINIGIYVPEVAQYKKLMPSSDFIPEAYCCVRRRIGDLASSNTDTWWAARPDDEIVDDVRKRLEEHALPFLARFETRDALLSEFLASGYAFQHGGPPRIICAIILAQRGDNIVAKELLKTQIQNEAEGHIKYVSLIAARLGIEDFNS